MVATASIFHKYWPFRHIWLLLKIKWCNYSRSKFYSSFEIPYMQNSFFEIKSLKKFSQFMSKSKYLCLKNNSVLEILIQLVLGCGQQCRNILADYALNLFISLGPHKCLKFKAQTKQGCIIILSMRSNVRTMVSP